jgi:predicted O-methyltransferase YrrM
MLPAEVYGELFKLGQASSGGTFVEIGTLHGAATIALALGAKQQAMPFHIYTVDHWHWFGSGCRTQFQKFGVDDCITAVTGSVADLVSNYALDVINLLVLDADGCIDRDLSYLFDKLTADCAIVIDDIDEWVYIVPSNRGSLLDQKHRLSNMLANEFTRIGMLREDARIHCTGFFRKGSVALCPNEILLTALPFYRELAFCPVDHVLDHYPLRLTLKRKIAKRAAPFVRAIYRWM